ncbi:MAG: hypothetical protein WCS94_17700 [Verrucomicrobiota bacterium]
MNPQIQSLFIGLAFLAAAGSAAPRHLRTHDTDGKLPSGSPARKRYRGCRLATAEAVSLLTLTNSQRPHFTEANIPFKMW